MALALCWSSISNNCAVYAPGPSSNVSAITLPDAGAAGVGGFGAAGLGILASFLASGFCRYLAIAAIGTLAVISPYDDGKSTDCPNGHARVLLLSVIMKLDRASLVTVSSRSGIVCWRCLRVSVTLCLAVVIIVPIASLDRAVRSLSLIMLPDCLSNVQKRVSATGCTPCKSCLILTMIDKAVWLLCVI